MGWDGSQFQDLKIFICSKNNFFFNFSYVTEEGELWVLGNCYSSDTYNKSFAFAINEDTGYMWGASATECEFSIIGTDATLLYGCYPTDMSSRDLYISKQIPCGKYKIKLIRSEQIS